MLKLCVFVCSWLIICYAVVIDIERKQSIFENILLLVALTESRKHSSFPRELPLKFVSFHCGGRGTLDAL